LYAGEAILMRKAHDIDSLVMTHWLCATNMALFTVMGFTVLFEEFKHVQWIDFGYCILSALAGNMG